MTLDMYKDKTLKVLKESGSKLKETTSQNLNALHITVTQKRAGKGHLVKFIIK